MLSCESNMFAFLLVPLSPSCLSIQQKRENDSMAVCIPEKADYLECLHHKEEFKRVGIILEQEKKNIAAAKAAEGQ